ncbi:MAG TPA: glycosyl transferase family 2, partial [Erysipelotrichaceae bacterium]|nr:glycosyl transferase family 2 [Erysipelotrichaceae bacterium]
MNANILVSVIVPMYNASRYLSTCLDSLASATFRDHMQVILVNDGSTDETAALAGSYVDRFPDLFQLVEKQNGGLSDARNFGLPYVKGTYLAFLDSDDWIEPDLYERLYQTIENEGADVCVCDLEYWFEDPSKRFVMKGLSQWQADTVQKKALLSPMFAWNKLYRAELFTADNGYRYPLHTWYED